MLFDSMAFDPRSFNPMSVNQTNGTKRKLGTLPSPKHIIYFFVTIK